MGTEVNMRREQVKYEVKGSLRVTEACVFPEGVHGYRNVFLLGNAASDEAWNIAGIDGTIGSHKLLAEQRGEEGVAGEYVSRIEVNDSISTGGIANVSGSWMRSGLCYWHLPLW